MEKNKSTKRKDACRFQMNFNFSDDEDEVEKKESATAESIMFNMKPQASILAGSSLCCHSELPSFYKDIGSPNAESTCLDHPEILTADSSLEVCFKNDNKENRKPKLSVDVNRLHRVLNVLKTEREADGCEERENTDAEIDEHSCQFSLEKINLSCAYKAALTSNEISKGNGKGNERKTLHNKGVTTNVNEITHIDKTSDTQSHNYNGSDSPSCKIPFPSNCMPITAIELVNQDRSASHWEIPSSDKTLETINTETLKEDKNEISPGSKEKRVSMSKSKLISTLFQSCSFQESPAEILALCSDEENRDPLSTSRENIFDCISDSASDTECNDPSQREGVENSQDFCKIKTHLDFEFESSGKLRALSKNSFTDVPDGDVSTPSTDATCSEYSLQESLTCDVKDNSFNGSYLGSKVIKKPGKSTKKQHSGHDLNVIKETVDLPIEQESNSSDDDNFENFVSQVKKDIQDKEEKIHQATNNTSWNQFIVDESEESSSDCPSDEDDDDDEDLLFYIKTNQKFEKDAEASSLCISSRTPRGQRRQKSLFSTETHSSRDSLSDSPSSSKESWATSSRASLDYDDTDNESLWDSIKNLDLNDKTVPKKSNHLPSLNRTTVATYIPGITSMDENCRVGIRGGSNKSTTATPRHQESSAKRYTKGTHNEESDNVFKTPKTKLKVGPAHLMTAPRPISSTTNNVDRAFFLKSLSTDFADWKRHPDAQRFVRDFKSLKADLASKLFRIFNEAIFDNKLPETILLEWSSRYTKTAGTFSYRQKNSVAKVTLSVKVCDSPERVRDTLAHEFCHAAVRMINGVNESHGPYWKSWAWKVNKAFPFLPVVARCHDYTINTKFTYQCINCKYRVGRHSKSLDMERKVCGHCHGRFELYLTKDLNSSQESTSYTPRAPNKFATYVKEHYSERKKKNVGMKHGEVMRLLSKEFASKTNISSEST